MSGLEPLCVSISAEMCERRKCESNKKIIFNDMAYNKMYEDVIAFERAPRNYTDKGKVKKSI